MTDHIRLGEANMKRTHRHIPRGLARHIRRLLGTARRTGDVRNIADGQAEATALRVAAARTATVQAHARPPVGETEK